MQPERRLVAELDEEGEAADQEAGNEDDEDGRAVARIGEGIVETAGAAAGRLL